MSFWNMGFAAGAAAAAAAAAANECEKTAATNNNSKNQKRGYCTLSMLSGLLSGSSWRNFESESENETSALFGRTKRNETTNKRSNVILE